MQKVLIIFKESNTKSPYPFVGDTLLCLTGDDAALFVWKCPGDRMRAESFQETEVAKWRHSALEMDLQRASLVAECPVRGVTPMISDTK